MTQASQIAKTLRKELKETFPNIKFSVTTENYSMGASIWVNSNDKINREAVHYILETYRNERKMYNLFMFLGN